MCGRYFLDTLPEFLIKRLSIDQVTPFAPRYNISPGQNVLVARSAAIHGSQTNRVHPKSADANGETQTFELASLRWGLIPFWSKDEKIGNRLINARSETASEKPAFRAAWRRRRALVPASGFYEWVRQGNGKQPYAIYAQDHQPFAIAALWERWDKNDQLIESCTLLTTQADTQISALHHRMPVIIPESKMETWLSGSLAEAAACISPDAPVQFSFHPVSTQVNRPINDDPSLLDRLEQDPPESNLDTHPI